MLLSSKQLIGLKVETKSGETLGHVKDFDIDDEIFEIKRFYVRPGGIVKGFVAGDLIISKNSIISINKEKMIVEDLAKKELAKEIEERKIALEESPASAMSIE